MQGLCRRLHSSALDDRKVLCLSTAIKAAARLDCTEMPYHTSMTRLGAQQGGRFLAEAHEAQVIVRYEAPAGLRSQGCAGAGPLPCGDRGAHITQLQS